MVAFGSFIGRVGHIEILFVSLIGTIAYTVNAQLFWNYFIVDCGYTMRTFLLGGVMGVFSGMFLYLGRDFVMGEDYNQGPYQICVGILHPEVVTSGEYDSMVHVSLTKPIIPAP